MTKKLLSVIIGSLTVIFYSIFLYLHYFYAVFITLLIYVFLMMLVESIRDDDYNSDSMYC